jgi:hypothetical protein
MNNDLNEFSQLIKQIQETPHLDPPERFTQNVMEQINSPQKKPGLLWMLKQTFIKTGQISLKGVSIDEHSVQATGFYFLLAGLFFFLIGAALLNSQLYMPHLSDTVIWIVLQSVLVLLASFSLVVPGMMLTVNIPDADRFARRALLIFMVLIMANALLIQEAIRAASGGAMAIAFTVAGIFTGIFLMKSMKQRFSGDNSTVTGELHHV